MNQRARDIDDGADMACKVKRFGLFLRLHGQDGFVDLAPCGIG